MQIMYIYNLQTSNYAYCHINPKKISYQALCLCQTYVTQTSGFVNKHANDFLYFLKRKCMHTRNDHLSPVKLVQLTNVTHVNGIYLTVRKNFLEHGALMLINEENMSSFILYSETSIYKLLWYGWHEEKLVGPVILQRG